jgi:FkbM family methyltransferase
MRRKGGLGFLPFDVPETAEIRFLRKLPLEGKVVYDVGAFEGILTLFFAGRARQVVSYEPNPRNYARCLENIRLNQLTNVQLLNRGVADAAGTLELIYDPRLPAAGSGNGFIAGQIQSSVREARKLSIPVISLDEDIAANHWPMPDFIKIDIEGMELAALRGLRRTISAHRPELYVELHGAAIEDKTENARAVVGLLDGYGYRIYDVENADYVTAATLGERRPSHIYCSA